jgi:hypothetical protein
MTTLDDHIGRVERYGFVRRHFPMDFKGHRLQILCNDAHILEDGRLLFDFTLHCKHCKLIDKVSGRFPAECEEQERYVVNAKIAVFSKFEAQECQPK